jgi:hypothetical protein
VLDNLAERLTIAHSHTLASQQQPYEWQPAHIRDDDDLDYARRWHDDHYNRDYGRSR